MKVLLFFVRVFQKSEGILMANIEMLIIKKGFHFSKWLLHHTGNFPVSYRFSVAAKLKQ